ARLTGIRVLDVSARQTLVQALEPELPCLLERISTQSCDGDGHRLCILRAPARAYGDLRDGAPRIPRVSQEHAVGRTVRGGRQCSGLLSGVRRRSGGAVE